ncbi:MAG: sulfatase-like hydrolase/transferase [Planctomycetes bacterium]|nr:sulfatase-like hydrolase/transferase [Planctomycetota bacterium]
MDTPLEKLPLSVPLRAAMPFLDAATKDDQPWACCISDFAPNEALVCSKEYYDLYADTDIPLPTTRDDDMQGRPNLYKRAAGVFENLSDDNWQEIHSCYYARISEMDAQFGRIVDLLEERNQLDSTIIIISTDHGRYLGAHGMDGHNFGAFEEIYNIPLIISGPGIQHNSSDARVGLHDLCPSILDLCAVENIENSDAQSLAPLLNGTADNADWDKGFAENHGTRLSFTQRVTWDGDWKYVFNGFDYDELYNIADDSEELTNRINDPALDKRRKEMLDLHWKYVNTSYDKPLSTSNYYTMHFLEHGPNYPS